MAAGLALRAIGLGWGLPDESRLFSYHPDEHMIVDAVGRMIDRGTLDPEFFRYGTVGNYLPLAAIWPAWLVGLAETNRDFHLIGRIECALLGAGTVWLVWLLGRRLYGATTGVIAAWLYAVAPGDVLHSHFIAPDVPAAFFATLALLLSARVLAAPSAASAALAGAAAGVAAATRYPVGLVLLATTAALLMRRQRLALHAVAAGSALGAFLAVCPFVLLDFETFWRDFGYELEHGQRGHGVLFEGTGNGWWHHLTANLPYALSPPLLAAALLGVGVLGKRRRPADLLGLAFLVPFFLLIGASNVRFFRYVLPLLPVLVVAAAEAFVRLGAGRGVALRRAALGVTLAWAGSLSLLQSVAMAGGDPKDEALAWMNANIPAHATVGLLYAPTRFFVPPITRFNGGRGRESYDRFLEDLRGGRIRWQLLNCAAWDPASLLGAKPDWFVLSEFEWREEVRLRQADAMRYLETLERDYRRAAELDSFPTAWRLAFGRAFAPHDWLYPFAQLRIYRRR